MFLAIALLASSLQAKDVKTKVKTVTYEGTKVNLGTNSLKVQFVDKLKGYEKEVTIGRNTKWKYTNLKKKTNDFGDMFYTVDVEVSK